MAKNQEIFRTKTSRAQTFENLDLTSNFPGVSTGQLTIGADGSVIRKIVFSTNQDISLAADQKLLIDINLHDGATTKKIYTNIIRGNGAFIPVVDLLNDIGIGEQRFLGLENGQSLSFNLFIDSPSSYNQTDSATIYALIEDY